MVVPSDLITPLKLDDVIVRRRGKTLLGPLSFELHSSAHTIVLGPNGSGKTTFLRLMHGLSRLSSGSVKWAADKRSVSEKTAFIFQQPVMLRRSVEANLIFPLRLKGMKKARALALSDEWLTLTGLGGKGSQPAMSLSGGEKQKLALARALISKPQLVFLDEPSASLDGHSTREIENILKLASKKGTSLVTATHDLGQARRLADQVVFLHKGQIKEQGPAGEFFEQPRTLEAQAFLRGDIVL